MKTLTNFFGAFARITKFNNIGNTWIYNRSTAVCIVEYNIKDGYLESEKAWKR